MRFLIMNCLVSRVSSRDLPLLQNNNIFTYLFIQYLQREALLVLKNYYYRGLRTLPRTVQLHDI